MRKMIVAGALVAVGLHGAAQAEPRPDPWGDATVSRADEQTKAGERFDALDTDHDSSLSAEEVKAASQGSRGPGGGLRRADENGDGKIGRDEYLAAQLRRFDMQDADKDGQLTKPNATPPARNGCAMAGAPPLPVESETLCRRARQLTSLGLVG